MNPQDKQRGLLRLRFLIVLGLLLAVILLIAYFVYGLEPSYKKETPVSFEVMRGESFRSIGARLSQEALIRSITVFKIYSFLTGSASKFQPGVYSLASTMSVPEIVNALKEGGVTQATVRIIEGTTLRDIDAALAEAGVTRAGAIVNFPIATVRDHYPFLAHATSLEGFLFPDTYHFSRDAAPETVVKKFLDTFEVKAWPLLSEKADWYRSLILASYLEKEVVTMRDRRLVAGILLKRISIAMPLQVDATIVYAKCGGALKACSGAALTAQDLKINSPYNTYLHRGWTPTPIGNPGKDAIQAAVTPLVSAYLYYLSTPDQQTIFSRTLQEHNTSSARYL